MNETFKKMSFGNKVCMLISIALLVWGFMEGATSSVLFAFFFPVMYQLERINLNTKK